MKKTTIIISILLGSITAGVYLYENYNIKIDDGKLILNQKKAYDAGEEIEQALNVYDMNKKAEVISNVDSTSKVLALSFEGISDRATMYKILDMLDKHKIKATFFIPGIKAAEDSSLVQMIQERGHDIESGTLNWNKNMEGLSKEELINDFCRTNKILETINGKEIKLLKCNSTTYDDNVLAAAFAAGNKYVVEPSNYLSYQSFKTYTEANQYIKNLKNGAMLSIKLEGVLDDKEYGKKSEAQKPAVNKLMDINVIEKKEDKQATIDQIVEWISRAIDEQDKSVVNITELQKYKEDIKLDDSNKVKKYIDKSIFNKLTATKTNEVNNNKDSINFKDLIEKNNKKEAQVVSEFFTTQKALAYTFRGISNEQALDKVLDELDKVKAKGTFFVTKDEILKYPDRINKIISRGHEIGNGGITNSSALLNKSTEEICSEIYEVYKLLKGKGINTSAYMPGYGYTNSTIKEALSVVTNIPELKNYELITYSKAPVLSKYKAWKAEAIVSDYFNVNTYVSLRKGEIVYFRLDSGLLKDDEVIPSIIDVLTKNYVQNGYVNKYNENLNSYELAQKSLGYRVVTINNLQNTIESATQFGRYSLINNEVPLKKRTSEAALSMMKTSYIGNDSVDLSDFNYNEQSLLDKSGTIDTKGESVVFLTFDDWGGDPEINSILEVLNKHNVKGTFFVIGKYTDINSGISNANPNLLRTIALDGNDIGSHNYNHELLVTDKEELNTSLTKSYNAMSKVIGDLNALRPYFRPPTMLLQKEGLLSVFENGYDYCVNGNITTHDYEKPSAKSIVDFITDGLVKNKGNVVVMHMNDQAYYTAQALDVFLTNNEKGVYGVKYKIAKLSDYLEK